MSVDCCKVPQIIKKSDRDKKGTVLNFVISTNYLLELSPNKKAQTTSLNIYLFSFLANQADNILSPQVVGFIKELKVKDPGIFAWEIRSESTSELWKL